MPSSETSPREDPSKRWWWVIGIVVPVVVAVVGLAGNFLKADSPPVIIPTAHITGDMYFTDLQVILGEYQEVAGETSQEVVEKLERSQVLAAGHQFDQALELLEEIAAQIALPGIYNNLGVLHAALGDQSAARVAYEKALAKDAGYKNAHRNQGLLDYTEGRFVEAKEHLRRGGSDDKVVSLLKELETQLLESEPNDDFFTPNSAPLDEWIVGTLSSPSDKDYYEFRTPEKYRDIIQFELSNSSTTLKPYIGVLDSSRTALGGTESSGYHVNPGQHLNYTIVSPPARRYYLVVQSVGEAGSYRLNIRPLKSYDSHEPNDDIFDARKIELSRVLEAQFMDSNDRDYYLVAAETTGTLLVEVENRSPTLKPHIYVYDRDRQAIGGSEGSAYHVTASQNVRYHFAATGKSAYHILVNSLEGDGPYRLTVSPE